VTNLSGHLTDAQAQRLLDGLLRDGEAGEVAAHLDACPDCAALVESYQALSLALEQLPSPELPADFTAGVLERVEVAERAAARERRAAAAVLAAAAAGLAAALVLGGIGGWLPSASRLADQLGALSHALQLGAQVLPPLLGAIRLPLAALATLLAFPLLFALSRFIPSPRTEAT
jgi:anti-sigma factor RsiW